MNIYITFNDMGSNHIHPQTGVSSVSSLFLSTRAALCCVCVAACQPLAVCLSVMADKMEVC